MRSRYRLGRPKLNRCVKIKPKARYFKPKSIPMSTLEEVELTQEELEALRLKNIEGNNQVDCAKKMKTSQSTFQRILSSAYKKISQALVLGKAIKIIDK
ncbi:hypothetical protein C0580_00975 [Candidatus Parcubacteria bacterium]|nr:MAG: hypothetical protein C0580_00975 [Candidatus Parcubacteria bacterium]